MNRITLEENLCTFKKYLKNEERSKNTIKSYSTDINRFLKWLKQIGYNDEITKEVTLAYKENLELSYSCSTTNRHLASFNSFMDYLGQFNLKLKSLRIQTQSSLENELSPDEVKKMIYTALLLDKIKIALIMQVIVATGIRISELGAITVEAVNQGFSVINSKGSIRYIIFSQDLTSTLKKYCMNNNINAGIIFSGKKKGAPISRQWISSEMKKIAVDNKIDSDKAFPHNLRHFFARSFINKGFPLIELADVLGHKSLDTTRIYTRTSISYKRKQLGQLGVDGWQLISKVIDK